MCGNVNIITCRYIMNLIKPNAVYIYSNLKIFWIFLLHNTFIFKKFIPEYFQEMGLINKENKYTSSRPIGMHRSGIAASACPAPEKYSNDDCFKPSNHILQ